MKTVISAKTLRSNLAQVIGRVRTGERFTVLYRRRPVCELVPVTADVNGGQPLEEDPIFQAKAVGRSRDSKSAADHDAILYGKPAR